MHTTPDDPEALVEARPAAPVLLTIPAHPQGLPGEVIHVRVLSQGRQLCVAHQGQRQCPCGAYRLHWEGRYAP